MRGRTVILFAIAVLCAGGTAVLVRSWLAHRPPVVSAPALRPLQAPQKLILVARAAIARGRILKPSDLVWRPWPAAAIVGEFVVSGGQSEKSFVGWVAREPFVAGEPILKAKILAPGDRGFLAVVLKPGMRAVSVAVDQIADVAGFVFPGDRVDLLVSLSLPAEANGGYQHKAAETAVRDIRVLAIDQRLDSKDGQAVVARTVTLEVTPKQSEIVALAAEMGKLALSLRSFEPGPPRAPGVIALAGSRAATPGDNRPAVLPADGPSDSINSQGSDSFTLDSEVSRLLPKPVYIKHNSGDGKVTILRGNGNSGTSAGSQPGS